MELTGWNRTFVLAGCAGAGVIVGAYAIHLLKQEGIGGSSLNQYR